MYSIRALASSRSVMNALGLDCTCMGCFILPPVRMSSQNDAWQMSMLWDSESCILRTSLKSTYLRIRLDNSNILLSIILLGNNVVLRMDT